MVRVIVCRPGETALVEEIDDSLDSMQSVVGGYIEEKKVDALKIP